MIKYEKYTWVCTGDCDALIEYTIKDGYGWPAGVMDLTCRCGSNCTLLSVDDATIYPTTTKEDNMETTTPQVITLDWIENDVVTNKTYTESDIRNMVWVNKNLTTKQNEWYKQTSQVRTILTEAYGDSEDQETLRAIAEALDIPLTRTVEWTASIEVSGTIELDLLSDYDADLESEITDNLFADSHNGNIEIGDQEVIHVREC